MVLPQLPVLAGPVLIVEDERAAGQRLRRIVREVFGAEVQVDLATGVEAARGLLQAGVYPLALVDVDLPDGDGIALVGWIAANASATSPVIVSAWAAEDTILAAIGAGAIGYLLKSSDDLELTVSLRSLQRGGAPIDPMIARRILERMAVGAASPRAPEAVGSAMPGLSSRESEILRLVARGYSNREIAELLELSRLTVEGHTKSIYRKLAVGSRTAAVFEAQAQGFLM